MDDPVKRLRGKVRLNADDTYASQFDEDLDELLARTERILAENAALKKSSKFYEKATHNALDERDKARARIASLESGQPVKSPVTRRGIYIASRVKHGPRWQWLRANGAPIISSWIDESGEGETADFGELWARIEKEIRSAALLVFYAAVDDFPLKGAYIEVGMALAAGVPVRVVLDGVQLEGRTMRPVGSWILDRRVTRFDSLDAAMLTASAQEATP